MCSKRQNRAMWLTISDLPPRKTGLHYLEIGSVRSPHLNHRCSVRGDYTRAYRVSANMPIHRLRFMMNSLANRYSGPAVYIHYPSGKISSHLVILLFREFTAGVAAVKNLSWRFVLMVSHHSTPRPETAPPEKAHHANHHEEEEKWKHPHPSHPRTRPTPGPHGTPLTFFMTTPYWRFVH